MLILYKVTGKFQIWDMVLREVLNLNQSTSPSSRAVGTIKLEQPMTPPIGADGTLDGFILFHRSFCHKEP